MLAKLMSFLSTVKLTITQYLLLTASGIIAILATILKFKEHELHQANVKVLQSHFEVTQQKTFQQISNASAEAGAARRKYENALRAIGISRGDLK